MSIYNNFEAGKVIVSLSGIRYDSKTMAYILRGVSYIKVEVIFPFKGEGIPIGDIVLVHLKCNKKTTVVEVIEQISNNPLVYYAEPNYLFGRHIIPNDPYYNRLWGLEKIKAPLAWNFSTGSSDVIVGVADSGIDYNHPDIRGNMWVSREGYHGWNFINNNYDPMDMAGHGTHVAGTIGAVGNNAIGIAGVCWRVKIAALRIGNIAFSLDAAIASINYANENNITIHNNSWGGRQYSPSLKHAINYYNGLFIASSGNSGVDNDLLPDYPASYDCDNIISVAATNPDDALAEFSNYGAKSVDIAAPGTDIFSLALNGEYNSQNGTSMSAPHVAGAVALLKSYKPNLTTSEIKNIILSSADKRPGLEGKVLSGGVLNVNAIFEMANRASVVSPLF